MEGIILEKNLLLLKRDPDLETEKEGLLNMLAAYN